MNEENFLSSESNHRIDINRVRYPHRIVWTAIPLSHLAFSIYWSYGYYTY